MFLTEFLPWKDDNDDDGDHDTTTLVEAMATIAITINTSERLFFCSDIVMGVGKVSVS